MALYNIISFKTEILAETNPNLFKFIGILRTLIPLVLKLFPQYNVFLNVEKLMMPV